MQEEWNQIQEYPRYEISNHGRVRHTARDGILSNSNNKHGYYTAKLTQQGEGKTHNIHSLVARYFANPFRLTLVGYIDRNKQNNIASNLKFCTTQQNIRNSNTRCGRSSLYKGAYFVRAAGKWRAALCNQQLGCFDSEVDAALAYDRKARETCLYLFFRLSLNLYV